MKKLILILCLSTWLLSCIKPPLCPPPDPDPDCIEIYSSTWELEIPIITNGEHISHIEVELTNDPSDYGTEDIITGVKKNYTYKKTYELSGWFDNMKVGDTLWARYKIFDVRDKSFVYIYPEPMIK
jgi:hypothetical protein